MHKLARRVARGCQGRPRFCFNARREVYRGHSALSGVERDTRDAGCDVTARGTRASSQSLQLSQSCRRPTEGPVQLLTLGMSSCRLLLH